MMRWLLLSVMAVAACGRAESAQPADPPLSIESQGETVWQVLEFYAPGCAACMETKPAIEELKRRCALSTVQVETVDASAEENEVLTTLYRVRALPTIVFVDSNGIEAARFVGKKDAKVAVDVLRRLGRDACTAG